MPPKPRPKKTPAQKSVRPRVAGRTPSTLSGPDSTLSGRDSALSGHESPSTGRESPSTGHDSELSGHGSALSGHESPSTGPTDSAEPTESTESTDSAEATDSSSEATEAPEAAESSTEASDDGRPRGKQRPVSRVSTIRPSATAAAAAAAESANASVGKTKRGGSRRGPSWVVPIALLVTAGVLGLFALIAWLHPGAKIGDNKAFIDAPATSELIGQAEDKMCVMFAVDATKLDDWAGRTRAVLTGDALKEFNDYLPANRDILEQTKSVSDCRPDTVGVSFLSGSGDGATARVVTTLIISETQMGQATNSSAPRAQFDFVKHGDNWVIEKIAPF